MEEADSILFLALRNAGCEIQSEVHEGACVLYYMC
jgi:hypothetical protein